MTDTGKPRAPAPSAPPAPADAYHPEAVEAKWQARWAERGTNEPDLDRRRAAVLHPHDVPLPVGGGAARGQHVRVHRERRLWPIPAAAGAHVFEPIGLRRVRHPLARTTRSRSGIHPSELIPRNIDELPPPAEARRRLMFDWRHELSTTDPRVLQVDAVDLPAALQGRDWPTRRRRRSTGARNDKTVLANEQVIAGACERCGTPVEQRFLEQWFFRITDYAERLLANLRQRAGLVGEHHDGAAELDRAVGGGGDRLPVDVVGDAATDGRSASRAPSIRVFTTRPDTIFGATYHGAGARASAGRRAHHRRAARGGGRVPRARRRRRTSSRARCEGEDRRLHRRYAINPATGQPIPIWIADYVLMEYGTGAIMAVPGHDERDFEFATQVRAADRARRRPGGGESADTPLDAGVHRERTGARW